MSKWINSSIEERRLMLQRISRDYDISVQAVEKDWWVTTVLKALFQTSFAPYLLFKGGTSLSKGWQIINRFSEDIDISLGREWFAKQGHAFVAGENKSQRERLRKLSRQVGHTQLAEELKEQLEALGITSFEVVPVTTQISKGVAVPIDSDKDPTVLQVRYNTVIEGMQPDYVQPVVKIEVSCLSLKEPFEPRPISSLLHETTKTCINMNRTDNNMIFFIMKYQNLNENIIEQTPLNSKYIYTKRYILKIKDQKKKRKMKKKLLLFCVIFSFPLILIFSIIFYMLKVNKSHSEENRIKVCLCSIGKDENLYVKEFVSHYKKKGYNHIFIYDNNDINGEKFEDVLQDEVNEGFVSIINYRGCKICQLKSYYDCYKKNNNKYNWLSFFDMDELIEFNDTSLTIQDFLENDRYNKCENVKVNWVNYTNESKPLYYENRPFQERFLNFIPNKHIKSTVRGNLSHNFWGNVQNPHTSLDHFNTCTSSGIRMSSKSPFLDPPDIKYARLKHYNEKSFEEVCIKIKRGKPTYLPDKKKFVKELYRQNKDSTEKIKIMKKIFGENIKEKYKIS